MTDAEWAAGWGDLVLSYPQREEAEEMTASRAALYRRHLDELGGAAWLFAVAEVVSRSRWFPTIAELREAAAAWRPAAAVVAGYLPPSQRSPEDLEREREESRAAAVAGLEMVRAAFEAAPVPASVAPRPRPAPIEVSASDERLDVLRAQAIQIQAAPVAEEV